MERCNEENEKHSRSLDDNNVDQMLREQERGRDPMANFIKKNNAKENNNKKVRHQYSGPAPPPNRFPICPGNHRAGGTDPVDLSRSAFPGLPAGRQWRHWPTVQCEGV